ncbi:MAG TPA: peptidylprolyl isomerase [Candidatus Tenderia electrophaga]|uniref:Peptidyl-prolyl cis-trans isomerase n=1 Tax=Candidatus Tenderia electrophaga TaxID=1748243 RepID=A0A832J5G6_9GAMM|nr:peptidylprolyl isomerase [Candidatus Tenderia electrophaga]
MVLLLDAQAAPETVANFVLYVEDGYYDGTIFHRVIKNFMIQGGGFTPGMKKKTPRASIKNEANNGLSNVRGSIAMARTSDAHSAAAQFFINTSNNSRLDYKSKYDFGYAVFGKVISGMDVVDNIRVVHTTNKGMYRDVPFEPIIIKKASLINTGK